MVTAGTRQKCCWGRRRGGTIPCSVEQSPLSSYFYLPAYAHSTGFRFAFRTLSAPVQTALLRQPFVSPMVTAGTTPSQNFATYCGPHRAGP